MFSSASELWKGFVNLFYPNLCFCCTTDLKYGEQYICGHCLYDLPVTGFYRERGNPVEQMFWGRVLVEYATANYFYKKGNRIQTLIHQVKYHGQKEIGEFLGREMGKNLRASAFAEVDMVVPVPLHPEKFRKRGYNQSEWIAAGVCKEIDKPLDTRTLVRRHAADSQTRRKRYERWENVMAGFGLTVPDALSGKHVLLIDDVITTGATLEACIHALQYTADTKVSVATLAIASS
ncbi:MAG: ComF family protein [Bacteroidales bacterium]|jgi:ComF family protein|nr:ComF family protein [Bacteroidales bacterium]